MAEIKKYGDVVLNLTIEDPANGRIQNYLVKGVTFVEHAKDSIAIHGQVDDRYKINLTFNKIQEQS